MAKAKKVEKERPLTARELEGLIRADAERQNTAHNNHVHDTDYKLSILSKDIRAVIDMVNAKKTIAQRQDEADYPALHDTIADLRKKLADLQTWVANEIAYRDKHEDAASNSIAKMGNQIAALEEAICPRVAARLTALEKAQQFKAAAKPTLASVCKALEDAVEAYMKATTTSPNVTSWKHYGIRFEITVRKV